MNFALKMWIFYFKRSTFQVMKPIMSLYVIEMKIVKSGWECEKFEKIKTIDRMMSFRFEYRKILQQEMIC